MIPEDELRKREDEAWKITQGHSEREKSWPKTYRKFAEECRAKGLDVIDYRGRFFYDGPAVYTHEVDGPTIQDVIRATTVKVQWDEMGKVGHVVYPIRSALQVTRSDHA